MTWTQEKTRELKEKFAIWRKKPTATFAQIGDTWSKQPILDAAFKDALNMLNRDKYMFNEVCNALITGDFIRKTKGDTENIVDIITKEDAKINENARVLRRRIMEYLAENSAPKLEASLILTSLVIDLERLGDYTKDLAKLTQIYPVKLQKLEFIETIKEFRTHLLEMFELTSTAFENSDKEKAQLVMNMNRHLRNDTDTFILDLDKTSLDSKEAIIYAMYVRFFRRVSAHLENIASSVVSPFPYLGFSIKEKKTEKVPED